MKGNTATAHDIELEMKRIIEHTQDGSATLFVPQLNEHYHSVKGARTESEHIFIDMGLRASTVSCPRVLEIGFGTGLNALLTQEMAEKEKRRIHYTGIELYPLTWEEVDALGYSSNPLFKEMHAAEWEKPVSISPHFTMRKMEGDANQIVGSDKVSTEGTERPGAKVDGRWPVCCTSFDVVYFDAFAPEKQPEMWSEGLFRALYAIMNQGGILTTYCAKGAIRRMLQSVGFEVERLEGPLGGKREILRATKRV